jgi:hypothetical protein
MPTELFTPNIENNNHLNPVLDQILSKCIESGEDPFIYSEKNNIDLYDKKMLMLIGLSLKKITDVEKLKVLQVISKKINTECASGETGCGGMCNTGLCPKAIGRKIDSANVNL